MLWTTIKRVCRSGFINFWRDGFVSLASISIMTVTLLIIGSLIFSSALFQSSLKQLRDRVDVSVYFVTSAPESDILSLKKDVETLPQVLSSEYLSREEVLSQFKERHQNDQLTLQALDELGTNPLGATLNIRAKDTSQYETITKFLESKEGLNDGTPSIISKINYYDKKTAIDSFTKIITASKRVGTTILAIFIATSIIITFVMIQLVIYSSRDEIGVMRLVGASTMYIRAPFMVTGIMYGIIAGIFALLILYGVAYYLAPSTEVFFGGINLTAYYISNFVEIFVVIIGSGIILGAISSFLAVRRYLTV